MRTPPACLPTRAPYLPRCLACLLTGAARRSVPFRSSRTAMLYCVAACCAVLQRVALCCSVLRCVAACYAVLQHVTLCCSMLCCVAACCTRSVLFRSSRTHSVASRPCRASQPSRVTIPTECVERRTLHDTFRRVLAIGRMMRSRSPAHSSAHVGPHRIRSIAARLSATEPRPRAPVPLTSDCPLRTEPRRPPARHPRH
jgi:hypothetical protein